MIVEILGISMSVVGVILCLYKGIKSIKFKKCLCNSSCANVDVSFDIDRETTSSSIETLETDCSDESKTH